MQSNHIIPSICFTKLGKEIVFYLQKAYGVACLSGEQIIEMKRKEEIKVSLIYNVRSLFLGHITFGCLS